MLLHRGASAASSLASLSCAFIHSFRNAATKPFHVHIFNNTLPSSHTTVRRAITTWHKPAISIEFPGIPTSKVDEAMCVIFFLNNAEGMLRHTF